MLDLSTSIYLGSLSPYCRSSDECLETCKSAATDPAEVYGATCSKFSGDISFHCCCFTRSTNACCKGDDVRVDCFVGGPVVFAA